ncbi:MAG: glutamine amidotransferase [Deltaproteobacteria bacterium]
MNGPVDLLVGWLAPDATSGAYNDWQIVATTTLAPWLLTTIALLLAVALAGSIFGLRRVTGTRRWILIGLRVLAAVWVMIVVLQPAIELRAVSRVRTRVALLADASRSMGIATPDGTRAEVVAEHLEDNRGRLEALAEQAVIEPMTFGERTHPVERLPTPLPTEEGRTDLLRALNEISWQSSGRELGAVLLYSDGADTQGLTVEAARRKAAKLGAPIYAVGFSKEASAPDLAIRRVLSDDFAFVHNTVTLDVELEERGLDVDQVTVTLKQDGTIIKTTEAKIVDGSARVSFEFKPRKIGKQVYQVSVPVQSGEVVDSNNTKSVVLKVIRDRIRVLQVAGRPSWDERFLRELLKRNPNVDLISFFILRSTTDLQKAPQEELALIPFPVNDLFTTELNSFDVVIYQNFSYRPYRMRHYLRNIRDYVLQGGSFLMIGGDFAFEDGFYAGTPIEDILPVRLGGTLPWDNAEFSPRLTRQGRRHPITRIGEPGEPPEAAYRRLPPLAGFNASLGLMPSSQSLLVHPGLPGNPPLVAIREVGQGRTMAVTTDSMWFWRFLAVADGSAGREFDRFWSNSLRWLIRDPELSRVRLTADRSVVMLGDPVGAEVKVLGPDYRGVAGAKVHAELIPVESKNGTAAARDVVTGPEGSAVLVFRDVEPGTYAIRVDARANGERVGRATEPVIVESADVELAAPFPQPEIMRALAESSGGRYIDVSESLGDIEIRDARRVEVDRTRRIPIWDTFFALITLLVVAGLEWWLRRRAGLL